MGSIALASTLVLLPGCYSIQNGWLDPTVLGNFSASRATEIRTSLTIEGTPYGILGAALPTSEDLTFKPVEYRIQGGDVLNISIDELRERFVTYIDPQVTVSATGFVNLPVVGRVKANDLTVRGFEDALVEALIDRDILVNPEVTVNPQFLQEATYSIFGIGVSASNNAPLRAGTFPIRRPNLNILEAINQVGGLNEFVTEVYVFRNDEVGETGPGDEAPPTAGAPAGGAKSGGENEAPPPAPSPPVDAAPASTRTPVDELLEAVDQTEPPPPGTGDPAAPPPDEADTAKEAAPGKDPGYAADPSLDLLEADPTDAWRFVNGEWVRNERSGVNARVDYSKQALALESTTPTVNWARVSGDTDFHVIRIPADELRNGNPDANIYVRAGDVIRVVSGEIGVYYVMGQVNRTGPFAFNSEPITLKAAIAAAGGLAPLAWPDRCTVYRRLGQREQMIQVDLDRIFAAKEPDFFIRRGDIINVGTHPFAPFLQRIRAMTLPNIINTLGYGFSYTRNFADIDSFAAQANPANRPDLLPQLFQ